jgi:hypothetical protein
MDIRSSKGVRITGPNTKFTGHSQRRCSDSYWSFGPVMNNLLLDIEKSLIVDNLSPIPPFLQEKKFDD